MASVNRTPEFEMVRDASKSIRHGLHDVAHKIALIIEADAWRQFFLPSGEMVEHKTFVSFVTTKEPRGLDTDVEMVRSFCRKKPVYLDLLDQALEEGQEPGARTDLVYNIHEVRPSGTGTQRALRRIRKDRPDLYSKVLAEEITPHRAMIMAGFLKETMTIPKDVDGAARAMVRHFSPDERALLARLILSS